MTSNNNNNNNNNINNTNNNNNKRYWIALFSYMSPSICLSVCMSAYLSSSPHLPIFFLSLSLSLSFSLMQFYKGTTTTITMHIYANFFSLTMQTGIIEFSEVLFTNT